MPRPGHWIRESTRQAIYERDDFTCQYCQVQDHLSDSWLTLDHLTPASRGGSNDPTNLVTACDTCNNKKNRKTLREFVSDPEDRRRILNQAKRRITRILAARKQDALFERLFQDRLALYGLELPDVPF